MWIVRLALRRPYTFVVAAMLVVLMSVIDYLSMPKDIFPNIDIPVISVIFNYTGMSTDDMEKRIVTGFERTLTTVVSDIEHTESQSLNGVGVIKIYLQKGAKIEAATAQVAAVAQTAIRSMPPGTTPPLIIRYNASSVPILQLSISSDSIPEQQLFDLSVNTLRPQLTSIPDIQIPYPYGGKQRNIIVDLDLAKLHAYGVSPADVSTAVGSQNLILPAGSAKIGKQEYQVLLNSSPAIATDINEMPIKTVNGTTIFIKDVASVRDGFSVQTNVAHANGKRGIIISILKSGSGSTIDVVDNVLAALPHIRDTLPPDMKVTPIFDQSVFVRASLEGVIKEAAIAAGLTGLMILLFLGSWRSTLIVMISIPLSIGMSIIILAFLGETLNIMTLGGMALAVGILVDDATVEIENIHRNLHQRKRLVQAILDGASQIAVPAFVSTLCICIVFVPVVFISGTAKYLFTPLSMSVVFAMMTSYLLSRTLVPTMVHFLLAPEVEMYGGVLDPNDPHSAAARGVVKNETLRDKVARLLSDPKIKITVLVCAALIASAVAVVGLIGATSLGEKLPVIHAAIIEIWTGARNHEVFLAQVVLAIAVAGTALWLLVRLGVLWGIHEGFNHVFEEFRLLYGGLLDWSLDHRLVVVGAFILLVGISCGLFPLVGTDFFPTVDAGLIRLHVRCPAGTRVEETARRFADVEETIKRVIPAADVVTIIDNMGIPNSSINLSLSDGSVMSPADGEILVALRPNHQPTIGYLRALRKELAIEYPDLTFFFSPADIVTQVLNFGLSAPIDIQIAGPVSNYQANGELAQQIKGEVQSIPGVVDVHFLQVPNTPDLRVNVDRTFASQIGVTQSDVASDVLVSLSSSNQTAPNFWLNPKSGISYNVVIQTPQYRMTSLGDLESTPVIPTHGPPGTSGADDAQLLINLAKTTRGSSPTNVIHYNVNPTFDVAMGVQGTDLGTVAAAIQKVIDSHPKKDLPRGTTIVLRGQAMSMHDSFNGLGYGLIFAIVLVYLLMVVNFQSWLDPLIILMALPGALSGILWALWITDTTISVPALMGAIMSVGVATANSILMITFANDQREHGYDARKAALAAGLTRLRPVMMTAAAMIIGMLPMSLGLGEGGEQNAPLGRAVIGGLTMATFATLFFVPIVYSLLRVKAKTTQVEEELK